MSSAADNTLTDRCKREVIELHTFFQTWFQGTTPRDFTRCQTVLAPTFQIVSLRGVRRDREALISAVEASYGVNQGDDFRIWIENYRVVHAEWGLALVTYDEWQQLGLKAVGRISTALFRIDSSMPNGVEWLNLHETRMPDGGVPITKGV